MCQIIIAAKVAAIKASALRIVVLDERNLVLPVRIELTTSPLPSAESKRSPLRLAHLGLR